MKSIRNRAVRTILPVLLGVVLIMTAAGAQGRSYAGDYEDDFWTWYSVQNRLNTYTDVVWLNGDLTAPEGAGPLVIPAGADTEIKLTHSVINRNLSTAQKDGYVIRVEGRLQIKKTEWRSDKSYITGGKNTGNGGGIYVANGGVLVLDAPVYYNEADKGGGIYVANGGAVYLQLDTRISNNTAVSKGGGIYVEEGGKVYQQTAGETWKRYSEDHPWEVREEYTPECIVSENRVTGESGLGGGVYCEGYYEMTGRCGILNNVSSNGGGAAVKGNGVFKLTEGTIKGNSATDTRSGLGGGIFAGDRSTVNISGGEIISNTADGWGGGVYLGKVTTKAALSGVVIKDNKCGVNGGGIYADGDNCSIRGHVTISNNKGRSGGSEKDSDMYLGRGKVAVTGWLDKSTLIGLDIDDCEDGRVFTRGLPGNGSPRNFVIDNGSGLYKPVTSNKDGDAAEAEIADYGVKTHWVYFFIEAMDDSRWEGVFIPDQIVRDGGYAIDPKVNYNGYYASFYYSDLMKNTAYDFSQPVSMNLILIPSLEAQDGFTVRYNTGTSGVTFDPISVKWSDDSLTPRDAAGEVITDESVRKMFEDAGAEFEGWYTDKAFQKPYKSSMTYSELAGGKDSVKEVVLYAKTAHIHKVDGADIVFRPWRSNKSLPTEKGNYYLTDNVVLSKGWAAPQGETNLCLNGCSITLKAFDEPVIRVSGARLNIFDDPDNSGKITGGNNTGSDGGGIRVAMGKVVMYGGTITGNKALNGAGVDISGSGVFEMYGGVITRNTASEGGRGGGINVASGTFTIGSYNNAAVTIADNKAGGLDSDVALSDTEPGKLININEKISEESIIGVTLSTLPGLDEKRQITSGLKQALTKDVFFSNEHYLDKEKYYIDIMQDTSSEGMKEAFAVGSLHGGNEDEDDNPVKISSKTAVKTIKVKYSKLRKKAVRLSAKKIMNVSGAKTKLTYKKVSVSKSSSKFKVDKNSGALTIKKGTKKGLYTIKIKVSAAGKKGVYLPAAKTVTIKIRIK